MVFAMLLRSPRSGRPSSWASGSGGGGGRAWTGARVLFSACASTSAFITLPCGPEPWSAPRSTPISRAIRRVTGVARTFRPSPLPACALICAPCADALAGGWGRLAVCRGAGCPACSGGDLGCARAVHLQDDQGGVHLRDIAFLADGLHHLAPARARDGHRRLVGHHFDERLVLDDLVAGLHQPFDDLALHHAFADVRQLELELGHVRPRRLSARAAPSGSAARAAGSRFPACTGTACPTR